MKLVYEGDCVTGRLYALDPSSIARRLAPRSLAVLPGRVLQSGWPGVLAAPSNGQISILLAMLKNNPPLLTHTHPLRRQLFDVFSDARTDSFPSDHPYFVLVRSACDVVFFDRLDSESFFYLS